MRRAAKKAELEAAADMRVCAEGFVRITGTPNALVAGIWRTEKVEFTCDRNGLKMKIYAGVLGQSLKFIDKLNREIFSEIDKSDCEILGIGNEFPLSAFVCQAVDNLYAQIRPSVIDAHIKIRNFFYDANTTENL